MTTTNERFDEQFSVITVNNLYGGKHAISIDVLDKDKFKTFISQEKNLLLDQAIESFRCSDCSDVLNGENCVAGGVHDTVDASQAISKLKELKE
jgi:hypothetical protein